MLTSMTGYGKVEDYIFGKLCFVEIRTLNHRYLDFNIKLPRQYSILEDKIRSLIKQYISRGRVDVYIKIKDDLDTPKKVKVDDKLAKAYYDSLEGLAQRLGMEFNLTISDIVSLSGVMELAENEEDIESYWPSLKNLIDRSLKQVIEMRRIEGEELVEDLKSRITRVEGKLRELENKTPYLVKEYQQKLKSRIDDLLEENLVAEERLAAEAAIFADKTNVTEEIVRLFSHLKQFDSQLDVSEAVGRKLDFLLQEMYREVNTISSKSADYFISNCVVELKSELEKMKEQVQNIE